jgi:succinate-acetate transporter protein
VLPAIGRYDYNPAVAMWLVTLAVITYMCAIVALVRDLVLVAVLVTLATGSVLGAIGFFAASEIFIKIAAYFCKWLTKSVTLNSRKYGSDFVLYVWSLRVYCC